RALRNRFIERWHGRERELVSALDVERGAYHAAARDGNLDTTVVWAGEAVDLISSVEPAGMLVRRIGTEAEERLKTGTGLAQTHRRSQPQRAAGAPRPTPGELR
ncbi:MAG: hypothetical protein H0W48_05880, partial [Methylibium sp.]|nr:hypothetical protein [Methylibium sp.]